MPVYIGRPLDVSRTIQVPAIDFSSLAPTLLYAEMRHERVPEYAVAVQAPIPSICLDHLTILPGSSASHLAKLAY